MEINIIKMISKYNFYKGNINRIKYIVIHYTGSIGSAKASCEYFVGGTRGASAHYFIDHNGDIYQSVEDQNSAWHCGSKTGIYKHPYCRNENSIGIELCCRTTGDKNKADSNWYFEDATVSSAIALTKELMIKYKIPAENVIRHYDVTGKICPAPYYYNTGKHTWDEFKAALPNQSKNLSTIQNQSNSIKEYTDQDMWNDFKLAGFPDVSIAAWFGNIEAESGLRSNNLQNSYEKSLNMTDTEYTAKVDDGSYNKDKFIKDKAGYGLCQWTYWSRKKAMYEYIVENKKKSIGDKAAQVSFLLYELSTTYSGLVAKLKDCKTVKEASDLILTQFERPADQSESMKNRRASYSQKYHDKYSGKSTVMIASVPFVVKVTIPDLKIRKGPGTNYSRQMNKYTGIGRFTIVEVKQGQGSSSGWGLLKTYEKTRDGWISLDFAIKE